MLFIGSSFGGVRHFRMDPYQTVLLYCPNSTTVLFDNGVCLCVVTEWVLKLLEKQHVFYSVRSCTIALLEKKCKSKFKTIEIFSINRDCNKKH